MRSIVIFMALSFMWISVAIYAQVQWEENEKKTLIKKLDRKGYQMRLYKDKGFFILRYVSDSGKQLGLSYWRVDRKPVHDKMMVHNSFSKELLKLEPSLSKL